MYNLEETMGMSEIICECWEGEELEQIETLVSMLLFLLQSSVWVDSQTGGDMNDIREPHFINKSTFVLFLFFLFSFYMVTGVS